MISKTPGLLSETEIIERYRTLGDDFACYGPTPPADAPDSLKEGYRAGRARHTRPRPPDRFIRKWLQLRYQALKRGRAVSDDVTLDFVRSIDVSVCPVTLVTLTYAELEASDWSVDRLNNNGAYALSNLAIISTRANRAKGAKSLSEVRQIGDGNSPVDGLTPREWARMAAIMFGPCCLERPEDMYYVRQVSRIPDQVTRFNWQAPQDCLVRAALGESTSAGPILLALLGAMPNNQLRGMTRRLVQHIQDEASKLRNPFDVWFDDDLFRRYHVFFEFLLESTHGQPLHVMKAFYDKTVIGEPMIRELHFESQGYVS